MEYFVPRLMYWGGAILFHSAFAYAVTGVILSDGYMIKVAWALIAWVFHSLLNDWAFFAVVHIGNRHGTD